MRVLALFVVCLMALPAAASAEESTQRRQSVARFSSKLAAPAPLRDAVKRDTIPTFDSGRSRTSRRTQSAANWVLRHPACLGSLLGFSAGFLIGYSQGDDGVFSDFDGSFSGLMLGGVGAGVGAIVGRALGK